MAIFHVYQPTLTDAEIDELNTSPEGWSHPKYSAYAKVTGFLNAENALARVREASGFYKQTHVVDATDIENVFSATNGFDDINGWVVAKSPMAKSGSVGDVVVNNMTMEMFICCAMGWHKLGEDYVKEFYQRVLEAEAA